MLEPSSVRESKVGLTLRRQKDSEKGYGKKHTIFAILLGVMIKNSKENCGSSNLIYRLSRILEK